MNYLNEQQCAECGGECCIRMPGATMPQDILNMFKAESMIGSLIKAFETGKWVIDCWYGDPREDKHELDQAYYIRPKNDDWRRQGLYSFSSGGRCVFHTRNGCELGENERPFNCRMLEPRPDNKCFLHNGDKRICSIAWIEYTDIIERAAQAIGRELA